MNEFPEDIISSLEEDFRKIGLYLLNSSVGAIPETGKEDEFDKAVNEGSQDVQSLALQGMCNVFIQCSLEIGNIAWSERVLDPESHSVKKQFLEIAPNEFEIFQSMVQEEKDDLLDFPED